MMKFMLISIFVPCAQQQQVAHELWQIHTLNMNIMIAT